MNNDNCYQCGKPATEQLPASNMFPDEHVPFCKAHAKERRAEIAAARE